VKSLLFIASAVFAAGVVAWLPSSRPALLTAILPIASVSLFAWRPLGRLGLGGQSWKATPWSSAWTKSCSGIPTARRSVVYWQSSGAIRRAVGLDPLQLFGVRG